ncbi:MAG: zinc ribbon domain-containing protein [Lachnospiraceae bacterium]|nr:zinc ribbon domain-containing protein [Lachnospiraceae bacterium]
MFCIACGKENNTDSKFCKYCGKPLIKNDTEEKKQEDPNKNFKRILVALMIIIFLLILSIVACLIYNKKSEKETAKQEEPILKEVAEAADMSEDVDDNSDSEELENDIVADEITDTIVEEQEYIIEEEEEAVPEEVIEISRLGILYAEASSELNVKSKDNATYIAGNIADGDFRTAWVEGVDGRGEGQVLVIHLDGLHKISSLKIYSGFLKTWARYTKNGKVTTVLVDYCNGQSQQVDLNCNFSLPEEEIEFDESTVETCSTVIMPEQECETDTIKLTIINAVAGSKYEDTAISEIEIYGN